MKTLLLTFAVLNTALLATGQGTLWPGQSYIYQFNTLPYESYIPAGLAPPFTSFLGTNLIGAELLLNSGPALPPAGASLSMSIFLSNDTSATPANTGTFSSTAGGAFPHLSAIGAWQGLDGAIELSVPANSSAGIPIIGFVVRAFLPDPTGGRDSYMAFVPFTETVPEPGTGSLTMLFCLVAGLFIIFKQRSAGAPNRSPEAAAAGAVDSAARPTPPAGGGSGHRW